jgi:hypothetical protein
MFLRTVLPEQHLSADSKDTVRLGMATIATMAALVLGLLVASAKNFYDTQSSDLTELSANVILLDRILAYYGPETKEVRDLLRDAVAHQLDLIWHQDRQQLSEVEPTAGGGEILNKIQALSPKNDAQRAFQAQALSMGLGLAKERWLMFEERSNSISIVGGAGFLARHCFRQLRPLRSSQCDRHCHLIAVRARGFGSDLLGRRDVHAF